MQSVYEFNKFQKPRLPFSAVIRIGGASAMKMYDAFTIKDGDGNTSSGQAGDYVVWTERETLELVHGAEFERNYKIIK